MHVADAGPNALRLEVSGSVGPLIAALAGHAVIALTSREPSLEEIFLHHYEGRRQGVSATRAIVERTLAGSRVRDISYASMFALVAYANVVGYRSAYPTLAAREGFVHAFGSNASVRLFYGEPHELLSIGGYTAWRVGGSLAIVAAIWGMLAAVRALRGEEDSGRQELVLSGVA